MGSKVCLDCNMVTVFMMTDFFGSSVISCEWQHVPRLRRPRKVSKIRKVIFCCWPASAGLNGQEPTEKLLKLKRMGLGSIHQYSRLMLQQLGKRGG